MFECSCHIAFFLFEIVLHQKLREKTNVDSSSMLEQKDRKPVVKTLLHAHAFSWGGFLWVLSGKSHTNDNNVIYKLDEKGWKDAGNYNIEINYQYPLRGQIVNEDIINC